MNYKRICRDLIAEIRRLRREVDELNESVEDLSECVEEQQESIEYLHNDYGHRLEQSRAAAADYERTLQVERYAAKQRADKRKDALAALHHAQNRCDEYEERRALDRLATIEW